jgi:hypothetical protein
LSLTQPQNSESIFHIKSTKPEFSKKYFNFFLHLLKFFSTLIFYAIKKKLKCFFTNFGIVNHSSGTSLLKQNVVR